MDITIIGTGNMARGIATRALAGGNAVTLLGTSADKAQALAGELSGDVRAGAIGDPISGDVVVLAVWYQVLDDVLGRYGDQLDGKVVVDITNPVDPQTFQPLNVAAGSAAQEIAQKVPGAKVVKAFNTTFAGTLVEGEVGGQPLDVFVASDDEDAKTPLRRPRRGQRHARRRRRPARHARQLEGPATCTWRSRAGSARGTTPRSRSWRSPRTIATGATRIASARGERTRVAVAVPGGPGVDAAGEEGRRRAWAAADPRARLPGRPARRDPGPRDRGGGSRVAPRWEPGGN